MAATTESVRGNGTWELKLTAYPANVSEGGKVTLKTTFVYHYKEQGTDDFKTFEYVSDLSQYSVNYVYKIDGVLPETSGTAEFPFDTSGLLAKDYTAQVTVSLPAVGSPENGLILNALKDVLNSELNIKDADGASGEAIKWISNNHQWILVPTTNIRTRSSQTTFHISAANQVQAAVTMQRSGTFRTDDQALWVTIRNRTSAIDFKRFDKFIQCVFCSDDTIDFTLQAKELKRHFPDAKCFGDLSQDRPLSFQGPYAYAILKLATQVFLTLECGVVIRDDNFGLFDQERERARLNDPAATLDSIKNDLFRYLQLDNPAALPYLDRIVDAIVRLDPAASKEVLPYCHGILQHRMTAPSMLELIWSYWQEEGMLVQTMNTIAFRFQNMKSSPRDPLGELEIDPLRPLNNLLWGFIQDEHNRLTVPRRAYEYDHHYGLKLVGKAVPNMMSADSRSKFIEAFHNLLYRTAIFYREDAETTVIADAFPLLNALRDVHLLLAEGAHNQFGDLPWTARAEMLMMQWFLARPEMREFLRGRHMVPYQEPWMGAVDCMKKLQGWSDTTITHFHELAVTGERIVLSIRYGDWSDINNIEEQAKNWARYWKPEIQRYIHGYYTVTGVDLMAEVSDTRDASLRSQQPSLLLQRRLVAQSGPNQIPTLTRTIGSSVSARGGLIDSAKPGRARLLRYKVDE